MSSKIENARKEGREAVGKTWQDCPYGHDQQELRAAWCQARLEADKRSKPLIHRIFFGDNVFSVIVGWILFLGAIAIFYKLYEIFFGCVDEFGRRYC